MYQREGSEGRGGGEIVAGGRAERLLGSRELLEGPAILSMSVNVW